MERSRRNTEDLEGARRITTSPNMHKNKLAARQTPERSGNRFASTLRRSRSPCTEEEAIGEKLAGKAGQPS
uniref:Uncharacterized protein n=1 Tax=Steinernema glaseri TaxID=37863 RepID=A0A1I7Z181_9BILA